MIKKEMKLLITFHTTLEAMMMENICKEQQMDGRLIPVPGSISAGCGLAWCAKLESEETLTVLMKTHGINPQQVLSCLI